MSPSNPRLVAVASILLLGAVGFFLFMLSIASRSNDPVELMRTVGTVSGGVGGLAIAMLVFGFVGRRPNARRPAAAPSPGFDAPGRLPRDNT